MGSVFEAVHRVTGKRFAIKWLLPELSNNDEAAKRFIREAQVAGRFDHPNVIEVYDIGQERGSLYMVMELLRGESLDVLLSREGRLSVAHAARILLPCVRAVARAHHAGIIHRDLKPANIFLCRANEGAPAFPKVLDFGISKMMGSGDIDPSITKGGVVMGTPHYMAPEQVSGKGIDARVDVYAFGVLLYELVSGQLPYPGKTYADLVVKIFTQPPPPIGQVVSGLPKAFVDLIERAMARSPDDRFPDLEAMALALQPFAGVTPAHGHPAAELDDGDMVPKTVALNYTPLAMESSRGPGASTPRHLHWGAGVGATCAAALGVTLFFLWPKPQAATAPPTFTNSGAVQGAGPSTPRQPPAGGQLPMVPPTLVPLPTPGAPQVVPGAATGLEPQSPTIHAAPPRRGELPEAPDVNAARPVRAPDPTQPEQAAPPAQADDDPIPGVRGARPVRPNDAERWQAPPPAGEGERVIGPWNKQTIPRSHAPQSGRPRARPRAEDDGFLHPEDERDEPTRGSRRNSERKSRGGSILGNEMNEDEF